MTRVLIIILVVIAGLISLLISTGHLTLNLKTSSSSASAEKNDDGHGHGHEGHENDEPENELVLSEQARLNLGLVVKPIQKTDFWKTIVVPGTMTEQPGHSERRISTNVNGVITKVYVVPGESVSPGDDLLEVQTTGEVLANAQSSLLKTIQDLELVDIELKRIEPLVQSGSIPGTRLLEKQYEKQRLETQRLVETQELLVRGLSPEQVETIVGTKTLIRTFTIKVPHDDATDVELELQSLGLRPPSLTSPVSFNVRADKEPIYSVEDVLVYPGKLVQPGEELLNLALHTDLRIVGMAFQKDAELINGTIEQQRPVTAIFESSSGTRVIREDLHVQYADNVVDPTTRLLRFYLPIKNEVVRDLSNNDDRRFRSWRFKPGQRVQLRVPVEHWTDAIVLPIEAVVHEGAESYVFRENGTILERVTVTVQYEDTRFAVLADDGSLFNEDPVAMNEAYQLNLALRKSQGGGVDMHAGHSH